MRKTAELDQFAPTAHLSEAAGFFLVGIGGAGMSGVARMLKRRGHEVRGTDSADSALIQAMRAEGIPIQIGHGAEGIRPGDAVILTDAIDLGRSPEVARARELGLPLFRRSQALGWLLRDRKVIAVTGTHGKTTTTAMIGAGLRSAGLDPLIVVGAEVPDFGSAIVEGEGEYAVVEACEAYASYLDLDPYISVLTNLELDHIDFHGNYQNLLASMRQFLSQTHPDGAFVVSSDVGAQEAAEGLSQARHNYEPTTWQEAGGQELATPGSHNRFNAGGALTACLLAGADPGRAIAGIASFRGADRRLQTLLEGPVTVMDDYAHHPTEIAASLQAIRERHPDRRLVVVYQPHLYSRTQPLISEFAEALSAADHVVLTDIYPAREDPIPGVSSLRIVEKVTKPSTYVPSRHLLPRRVAAMAQPGDLIVGMGAGSIGEFAPELVKELARTEDFVAVFYGGESPEREVSLNSGRAVKAALDRLGIRSALFDATDLLLGSGDLSALRGPNRPTCAILSVHGKGDEDGPLQGLLNMLHIPFSGSRLLAAALGMDKQGAKQALEQAGVPTPRGRVVRRPAEAQGWSLLPAVVKPNDSGSTVGLFFVADPHELAAAVERCLQYTEEVLIEEEVRGIEISVPVMGDRALLPVEVAPISGRYDFASKYVPGATEEICPARITEEQTRLAQDYALLAHRALGCQGITRTDMIVQPDRIVALEVNTCPGMTPTSLVPKSAETMGMSFDDVVAWMVGDAKASRT